MDFTLTKYEELISSMGDYEIIPVREYDLKKKQYIILRHDVDKKPQNALRMAELEHKHDIRATYYFRIVPESFDASIIKKIAKMGHEIGYHYETMNSCKGNVKQAIKEFEKNLKKFRKLVTVDTVVMHGSPLGKYDNRDLWKHITLDDYGLRFEPYLSFDYNKLQYFSDTGRTWAVTFASVRDFVPNQKDFGVKTTEDLIKFIKSKKKKKILILAHPQRWACGTAEWCTELVTQNVKNIGKTMLRK